MPANTRLYGLGGISGALLTGGIVMLCEDILVGILPTLAGAIGLLTSYLCLLEPRQPDTGDGYHILPENSATANGSVSLGMTHAAQYNNARLFILQGAMAQFLSEPPPAAALPA